MPLALTPLPADPHDGARLLQPLLEGDPTLRHEFRMMLAPGRMLESLRDSHIDPAGSRVAFLDGALAGFSLLLILPRPGADGAALVRIGIAESHRRQGLGTALLAHALDTARARPASDRVVTVAAATWRPHPSADGFLARHDFSISHSFWEMARADAPTAEPAWPAGVTTRCFEGRERDYADWLAIHNSSFAGHYLFSPATLGDCRRIAESPTGFAGGLLLAERDGACVGYCRLEQLQGHGEVAMVGVAPETRGQGLGRALLRWGVATLAARGLRPIRLTVDGLNESAVRLYRQERFEIEQTRDIWERAL